MTINGGKENYSEIASVSHQSAFYPQLNASAMHLMNPQLFAHPALMHQLMFPSFWPPWAPLHYTLPSQHSPEAINNNYLLTENHNHERDEMKRCNDSSYSGSDSPRSQMNDSVEITKFISKKDPAKNKHFECKFCGKVFGYKHVLQNHEKVHTGEKSYQCTKCNKCFRRDHHLKVHMRLHSGEKPFSCDYPNCDRKFVQVANLRRHLKTHENVNLLKVHDKMLKREEKFFASDSSKDSLELKTGDADYIYENLRYNSPVQSEPEDLSTKSCPRNN